MFKKISIGVGIVGVIAIILASSKIGLFLDGRKSTLNSGKIDFFFNSTGGSEGLADQLLKLQVIDNREAFLSVAEYKNLDKKSLASGKDVIDPNTS